MRVQSYTGVKLVLSFLSSHNAPKVSKQEVFQCVFFKALLETMLKMKIKNSPIHGPEGQWREDNSAVCNAGHPTRKPEYLDLQTS